MFLYPAGFNMPAAAIKPRFAAKSDKAGQPERRLASDDSLHQMVLKLADGNPMAVEVLVELAQTASGIDADYALGGYGPMITLDVLGIYGDRIARLYTDVSGREVLMTHALLLAAKTGLVGKGTLNHAIDHYGEGLDTEQVFAQVIRQLRKK